MAAITSTEITSTPRGGGDLYVMVKFTIDTGDIVTDGPRFFTDGTDLNAKAAIIGQQLLEGLVQAEVDAWLSA